MILTISRELPILCLSMSLYVFHARSPYFDTSCLESTTIEPFYAFTFTLLNPYDDLFFVKDIFSNSMRL